MTTQQKYDSKQGLATLQRPRYSAGLLLEADDLTAGVDYTREFLRLMLRSLFGCGVVCGLGVHAKLTCNGRKVEITIDPGLALDCLGNPIQVPKSFSMEYDPECKEMPEFIWVTACYIEKCCRPKDVSCSPDDDGQIVQTRSHEGFEVRLYYDPPECACSCAKPATKQGEVSDRCCKPEATKTTDTNDAAPDAASSKVDVCACYKDHNAGKCACDCGCTCVVIGKIQTKIEKPSAAATSGDATADHSQRDVVDDMVRRIRPILTGYLGCLQLKDDVPKDTPKPTGGESPQPSGGTPPPPAPQGGTPVPGTEPTKVGPPPVK
jgi:hypothetical protein